MLSLVMCVGQNSMFLLFSRPLQQCRETQSACSPETLCRLFVGITKDTNDSEVESCTDALPLYICKEMESYTVQKPSFRELLCTFERQSELPRGRTYSPHTAMRRAYDGITCNT